MIFKISKRIFFTYLPIHLFTEALSYLIQHTYCVFVFIFVKGITPRFNYPWDEKRKKNKSQFLDYICRLISSIYLISYYYSINHFDYFFKYICYLFALCSRCRQSESFLLLKCFYSRELDDISFQTDFLLI